MEAVTAESLMKDVRVDPARWDSMPGEAALRETAAAMDRRGFRVVLARDRKDALEKDRELLPEGAEIMHGSSTTLIEIGFMEALERGDKGWRDVYKSVTAENDQARRNELRRKSVCSDYFIASVNAIAKSGELVACDAGGSRVGALPFAAKNLIIVAGANKIVPTLEDALLRVREFAFPLEDGRMRRLYGRGSNLGKFVIMAADQPGRLTIVLVNERLGY